MLCGVNQEAVEALVAYLGGEPGDRGGCC
jgi:hypothetical protein